MAIGYACLTLAVPHTDLKHCLLKNADRQTLLNVSSYNLDNLENAISYALEQGIRMFRISSDIIPFGSRKDIVFPWWELFAKKLGEIGKLIADGGMRVSMHPGQYTVLNSPREEVVENSIADLAFHTRFLDSLGLGSEHKLVLHIGGVYGDKKEASRRFCDTYEQLDQKIKNRLIIENDDKSYTIEEVLDIARTTGAPVVFDNLHHMLNPPSRMQTDRQWIEECHRTWKKKDGREKIHYSQQNTAKKNGSHSSTISIEAFLLYASDLSDLDVDIMLEVKDKNISAIKCMLCLSDSDNKALLLKEWERYRHLVYERDLEGALELQNILQVQDRTTAVQFYHRLEEILNLEPEREQSLETAKELFNAIASRLTKREKTRFELALQQYKDATISLSALKGKFLKLCEANSLEEILTSYYFYV
jgi:UV DNA damage endonuclease